MKSFIPLLVLCSLLVASSYAGTVCSKSYTVKSGDYCYAIAQAQATTVDNILKLNPSVNAQCTNLQVGQVLCLAQTTVADPPPTPTPTPTPTPPAATTKVGLAWGDWQASKLSALTGVAGSKIKWIYTWSAWNIDAAPGAGLEFIPMLWGPGMVNDFNSAKASGIWNQSSAILGFNEPDLSSQSNLSPAAAVTLWKQYLQPMKALGKRLGAPAVTSSPTGKPWLQQFISQCTGCTIDFIPLHWYGSDPVAFQNYVTDIHTTFNKPIWVTEWACVQYGNAHDCNQQFVYDFMGQTSYFLDTTSWVERYSWFGALKNVAATGVPSTDGLLSADGQSATPLGTQFAKSGHA